jgi:hypothetical protein
MKSMGFQICSSDQAVFIKGEGEETQIIATAVESWTTRRLSLQLLVRLNRSNSTSTRILRWRIWVKFHGCSDWIFNETGSLTPSPLGRPHSSTLYSPDSTSPMWNQSPHQWNQELFLFQSSIHPHQRKSPTWREYLIAKAWVPSCMFAKGCDLIYHTESQLPQGLCTTQDMCIGRLWREFSGI